ncbi:beta-galactosidase trimerization domain-containing protein [bacterium]|nr:beta-galactosidase trimerization domain-containing protein [bacterium]
MASSGQTYLSRRHFMRNAGIAAGTAFAAGIRPVYNASAEETGHSAGWFDTMYRQFHIDAHFGGFREIYRNFDAEATAQMYEEAGIQMVSYFSKCWAGYSYYPTKIGVVHPGLDRDFTGELTAALKKRGIRRILYFMLGMERRHQYEHPEWIRNTDSKKTVVEKSAIPESAMMCFNSPYVDEIGIPQMKEIIALYDIDGFFVDIVMQQYLQDNCWCKYCREYFANEVGGAMPSGDSDPKAFAYRKWANRHMEAHMEKVQRALAEVKPDIEIINNYAWMMRYPVTPPRYVHHITWDTPVPKVGLYSWNFSLEARYVSTLPDITWSCMNTRGNTWGEYSLREPEAFMSECAILLAACGRTYLSDIPYPHGNPDPAVMEVFGAVNRRTRELEPYVKNCMPVTDTAVLHSPDSVWSKMPMAPTPAWIPSPAYYPVCGAHKALIDGHIQMGILNSGGLCDSLSLYRALVLPDQRILSDRECETIRAFVKNGGALLATGETGTRDTDNKSLKNCALADVLGVDYLGTSDTANCYLRTKTGIDSHGIPAMDIQVMGPYGRVKTTTAKTLIELVPPFEGIKNGTPPPALSPEGPGVTVNMYGKGRAVYCAAKLFDSYYRESTPVQRKLGLWMLEQVYPPEARTIVLENTPVNVEVFYNRRGKELFVHLVNYSGDKREVGTPQVQDFAVVHGIRIRLQLARKPAGVTTVPGGKTIPSAYSDGWLTFTAEPLAIHEVYRIET